MTKPDCSVESQSRSIYPGQRVEFIAISIDQSLSGIPTLIHTAKHSGQNVTETTAYKTGENCTMRSVTPNIHINQLQL